MAKEAAIVISWGGGVAGREGKGLEVFMDALTFWGKKAADGKCEPPDAFWAEDGSGGMLVIKGKSDALREITESDDGLMLNAKAQLIVQDLKSSPAMRSRRRRLGTPKRPPSSASCNEPHYERGDEGRGNPPLVSSPKPTDTLPRMPNRDHNPHKRRLYLPIVDAPGSGTGVATQERPEELGDTHEAHSVGCAQTARPSARRPDWLRVKARTGPNYSELKQLMRSEQLHTVCEEAGCPNIYECWEDREATFLLLGDRCTRRCGFCDVMTAKPFAVDEGEPRRIADAVAAMGLRYVVITGVARDDLPDGGARIWAKTVAAVRSSVPGCGVEVLPADFKGGEHDIATVIEARPDVFAHNLETVRRLHARIRPAFGYDRSLEVLRMAKRLRPEQVTKSNLILGMGERPEEVPQAMRDLRDTGCDLLTMGQYLQPTRLHLPVDRWVTPEEFDGYAEVGREMGFAHVEAGPLVRSSYHAGKQLSAALGR